MTKVLEYARFAKNELGIDWHTVASCIANDVFDFEADNYRFIHQDEIDRIQQEELESDEYTLGCFNASFLAGVLGLDTEPVEAIQSAGAYEALGKMVINGGHLAELQGEYAGLDGYGHHFAHYDGNEQEVGSYYVFRVN